MYYWILWLYPVLLAQESLGEFKSTYVNPCVQLRFNSLASAKTHARGAWAGTYYFSRGFDWFLSVGMWGISKGFISEVQDGGHGSCKDLWVPQAWQSIYILRRNPLGAWVVPGQKSHNALRLRLGRKRKRNVTRKNGTTLQKNDHRFRRAEF